jgi:hypothetical protein
MKNRTPVPRQDRPPLPGFDPVPRKSARHDGWTPDRQKAFIEALADTGSVSRAAAMVNMSAEGAYYLRRQPGADGFRRAWEAALDYGVARMKDIAFERAVEGYLVPCFVGGKLIGWRRKYNDRLLMFCLRHYGEDASGKRTKIEYFSTRASAAAGSDSGHSGAASEASTTTVRTVMSGKTDPAGLDHSVALIDGFQGIDLDDTAREEILAVLRDCAERRRSIAGTPDDPDPAARKVGVDDALNCHCQICPDRHFAIEVEILAGPSAYNENGRHKRTPLFATGQVFANLRTTPR